MVTMDRVGTGILNLDKLLEGGFPANSAILVTGTPGSGKTIMGLQYLNEGALKGEKGVYFSLEDSRSNIIEQAKQFGWDLKGVKVVEIPVNVMEIEIMETLKNNLKGAKRIVIDSLSVLHFNSFHFKLPVGRGINLEDVYVADNGSINLSKTTTREDKSFIYDFITQVKQLGVTSFIITDSKDGQLTYDGVSEFISDGVLKLGTRDFGKTLIRTIEVMKMRRTNMKPGMKTLEFTKKGLVLKDFSY